MAKRASPEVCGAFYEKYAAQLEECLHVNRTASGVVQSCREIVKAARLELGYSNSTSTVDILSPLRRGYRLWKAGHVKEKAPIDTPAV